MVDRGVHPDRQHDLVVISPGIGQVQMGKEVIPLHLLKGSPIGGPPLAELTVFPEPLADSVKAHLVGTLEPHARVVDDVCFSRREPAPLSSSEDFIVIVDFPEDGAVDLLEAELLHHLDLLLLSSDPHLASVRHPLPSRSFMLLSRSRHFGLNVEEEPAYLALCRASHLFATALWTELAPVMWKGLRWMLLLGVVGGKLLRDALCLRLLQGAMSQDCLLVSVHSADDVVTRQVHAGQDCASTSSESHEPDMQCFDDVDLQLNWALPALASLVSVVLDLILAHVEMGLRPRIHVATSDLEARLRDVLPCGCICPVEHSLRPLLRVSDHWLACEGSMVDIR